MSKEKLKGGSADGMSLKDIEKKHKVGSLSKELIKGIKDEMEHTKDEGVAKEIALDHLSKDPHYYTKEMETKEQTMADASGSFETGMSSPILKKDIYKRHGKKQDVDEVTDASSSGAFDVPAFGKNTKGRRDPLKIDGVKSIAQSRAVKDPKWPKFGGPGGVYVKVKEKCKKFPYCNQGDINAIEPLREAIEEVAKKYGLPINEVENIVLNEIKQIFI